MPELSYDKLTPSQIEEKLQAVRDWSVVNGALTKSFTHFNTYPEAALFATAVSYVAEALNHHPDILIGYKTVTVSMVTHDAGGGLTAYDFELARRIDVIS